MLQLKKMTAVIGTLFLVLSMNTWAAEMDVKDAQAVIKQTTDKMLMALKTEKDNLKKEPERVYGLVEEIVLEHFDFKAMSKKVLGKSWRKASKEEQTQFITEFQNLLVRTYATSLVEVAGEEVKVNYLPVGAPRKKNVVIKTQVSRGIEKPVDIDYRMHFYKDGKWRAYDIKAAGISLVTTYRSEFNNDIQQGGMSALIKKIADRNNQHRTAQAQ